MSNIVVTGALARLVGVTAPSVEVRAGVVEIRNCRIGTLTLTGHLSDVRIVDTTGSLLVWTGDAGDSLTDLVVDGGRWDAIGLVADTGTGGEVVDLSVRCRVPASQPWGDGAGVVTVVGARRGVVDVQVGSDFEYSRHGVHVTDCVDLTVVGHMVGPNVDDADAVHVVGGEACVVRGSIRAGGVGFTPTRHGVNVVSGVRHRILADLGADADYDAGAVADAGTGTIDQSVVD